MTEFLSDRARRWVEARGVSQADIEYCLCHFTEKYRLGPNTVYRCQLPDGRFIKVAMRSGCVDTAFYHH